MVTTSLTTLQTNAKAMLTRANITLTNNYTGSSQYWSLNSISQNYYSGLYNTTTKLIYFIGNITKSVADTKTTNYPSYITALSDMAIALETDDAYGSNSSIPTYLASNYSTIITNLEGLAGTFSDMMLQAIADEGNLTSMNKPKTPQNALQCLPNIIQMYNWQINFMYQIGNLSLVLGNATKDMDFAYFTFKTSDASVISLEKQLNYTIGNFSSSINKTMVGVNATLFSYVGQVNASLVKANAALPASVRNSFIAEFIQALNSTVIGYSNALNTSFAEYYDKVAQLVNIVNSTVLGAYPNLTEWTTGRSSIITQYLENVTTLTCASQAVNATERFFTAMGGAPRIFNCTDVEAILFQSVLNLNNVSAAVMASEIFIESNYIKNCTFLPLNQTNNATVDFSKTDCVALVSIYYK